MCAWDTEDSGAGPCACPCARASRTGPRIDDDDKSAPPVTKPAAPQATAPESTAPQAPTPKPTAPQAAAPKTPDPQAQAPKPTAPQAPASKPTAQAQPPKTPPKAQAPKQEPAPKAEAPKQPAPGTSVTPPPATATAQPLDLEALKTQLKETKAIGVFTKLTLKNQVDDLLDKFREHHAGKAKPTMAELRRSYDLLMMKVLTLLQDHDQRLASAIVSSREAIWGLLADPKKFAALQA